MNKAVFLDRDGVIIRDTDYGFKLEDTGFLPGALTAIAKLSEAGFKIIVVTNQSGIGRGYFSAEDVEKLHQDINDAAGGKIEKFYYCKHKPEEGCDCRKPSPHFVFEAQKEFDIDLSRSYFVGDRDTDVECGENAGVKESILVSGEEDLIFVTDNIILKND
ncbi:MAG: HAD family hydrolase [Patescibacteria group bacterium]|nr:HAD family hydrolase [Patescibacteria group bacterium]